MKEIRYWTPEEDAYLREHWCDGMARHTADMIGKVLNRSRGSVVGRIDRLGLFERDRKKRSVSYAPAVPKLSGTVEKAPAKKPIAAMQTSGFKNPGFHTCQWIEGEARERKFCKRKSVHDTAWCAHHYSRVYIPRKKEDNDAE